MDRTLAKDKFLHSLNRHPANIKYLVKPTPEFVQQCFNLSSDIILYAKQEWLDTDILKLYISKSWCRTNYLDKFPRSAFDGLPTQERDAWLEDHAEYIGYFSNVPNELWVKHAKEMNIGYAEIPANQATEEFYNAYVPFHIEGCPEELLTDRRINRAMKIKTNWGSYQTDDVINQLPAKFLTRERIMKAFELLPELSLTQNLPRDICDLELITIVLKEHAANIEYISTEFLTKELALHVIAKNNELLEHIPKKFIDEDLALVALTSSHTGEFQKYCQTKKQLLKLAVKDFEIYKVEKESHTPYGISNFKQVTSITNEWWVEVLRVCPSAIQLVSKPEQTNEMIEAFLTLATSEIINDMSSYIDLRRIKKANVPFLMGLDNSTLGRVCERRIRGTRRKKVVSEEEAPVETIAPAADAIVVDMPDSLYGSLL